MPQAHRTTLICTADAMIDVDPVFVQADLRAATTELPTTLCDQRRAGIRGRIIRSRDLATPHMAVNSAGFGFCAPRHPHGTRGPACVNAAVSVRLVGLSLDWPAAARHDGWVPETIGNLVERFYSELWNRWNDMAVEDTLSPAFRFRGSLGQQTSGREGWRRYRDLVRAGSADFCNEIVELVCDGLRAAARLRYTGTHTGVLLGLPRSHAAAVRVRRCCVLYCRFALADQCLGPWRSRRAAPPA
jgi:hypothetical protein